MSEVERLWRLTLLLFCVTLVDTGVCFLDINLQNNFEGVKRFLYSHRKGNK